MTIRIPFNKPHTTGREFDRMQQCLRDGHISGDGSATREAAALLEARLPGSKALLTTSCTHALEMAALLLDLGPGDEVILPAFTFVSTANAVVLRGATPVFVDVDPDTLNLDPHKAEAAITEHTKAIFVVHYAGIGCDMAAFQALADRRQVVIVEDAAHAIGATWQGRPLGTFGSLATFSFHETKNLMCGEGGALVVTDSALAARAEILREKGTNRSAFYRGEVDKYTWVDVGSSYLMGDLLAAFLVPQLEDMEAINGRRLEICARYREGLVDLAERGVVDLPVIPPESGPNGHLFHLRVRDLEERTRVLHGLRDRGILATFHYVPLHLSPMGRRYGYQLGDLPVTEREADRLIRLPLYADLADDEVDEVVAAVREVLG